MLVLSRKKGEALCLGDDVTVTVVDVRGGRISLGIEAPKDLQVSRKEVYEEMKAEREKRKQREERS